MKLRFLAVLLGLTLCGTAARAQVGVYVNPVFNRISNSQADSGVFAFMGSGNTSAWFKGVDFGAYASLIKAGTKVEGGLDARGVVVRNQNANLGSFLIGPRVSYMVDSIHSRAYAEVIGGIGRSHAPTNPKTYTGGQFEVLVGLDKPFAKYVDWRVVEVGYGTISTINTPVATGAGTGAFSASKNLWLSTGLVFRF